MRLNLQPANLTLWKLLWTIDDKDQIDKVYCEKNNIRDTAIRTFSFSEMDYYKGGKVEIPYTAFVSPSNRQTKFIAITCKSMAWTRANRET